MSGILKKSMGLKQIFIFGVALVILFTTLLSTLGVSILVKIQNDEHGLNFVEKSANQVKNRLVNLEEQSLSRILFFTSDPSNIFHMKTLVSIKTAPDINSYSFILDGITDEMSKNLWFFMQDRLFDGIGVYDRSGKPVIRTGRNNDGVFMRAASFDEDGRSLFKFKDFFKEGSWEEAWKTGPSGKEDMPGEPVPGSGKNRTWYSNIDGRLALSGRVFFKEKADENGPPLGHVFFYKFLDHAFVETLARETEMEVSLFGKGRLILGANPEIDHFPKKLLKDGGVLWGKTVVNSYENDEYYQTAIPLRGEEDWVGALVVSFSRKGTLKKTGANIMMLMGIMGLSLLVAIPATFLLGGRLTREINNILAAVNEITDGNPNIRVPVKSGDELGKLAGAFNKMTEDLHKTMEMYKESAEKYQNLFDCAPDGIIINTPEGEIISTNDAFLKMLKYKDAGEMAMFKATDLYFNPEKDFKQITDIIKKHGGVEKHKVFFKDSGGGPILVSVSSKKIQFGNKKAYQSIIRDITEREKTEEEIKRLNAELEERVRERTSQLESANHNLEEAIEKMRQLAMEAEEASLSKSEFLANVSHEIRTPMNGIIGTCEVVLDTELNRKQREYLNIIMSSARSLLGLINDILDFSKIEAGKLDFDNIPFSIREVVEEVCDLFFDRNAEKECELIVDIAESVPEKMISDPFRLRQVLTNLASNAFKFTEKGEICISVKRVSPLERVEAGDFIELLFCVQDTGIGIAPEIQSKLFDAFTQADGSISREYGGTGLGLAICKTIVNMMKGDIWVESAPGVGSSFFFNVKFKAAPPEKSKSMESTRELANLKVLIVEDNESTQIVLTQLIESFGCKARSVNSAEEAMSLIDAQDGNGRFDIILMDFRLPGMDGIKASGIIKKKSASSPPAIIIISGFIRENDIQKARDAGVDSYLIKPVKRFLLYDNILELIGKKPPPPAKRSTGLVAADEFSGVSLLLVEDNAINRRVACELLWMAGLTVDSAESGIEALDAVKKKSYDAVLMDVQMPGMDGLEATKAIRGWEKDLEKHTPLPIIAMTAHAMSGDRKKCLEAGMNDYLAKPIDRKELFSVIRKNIGKSPSQKEEQSAVLHWEEEGDEGANISPLPEEIRDLPGLEMDEGVERMGGSVYLFAEILGEFCKSHEPFGRDFSKALTEGDFTKAMRMAHSLKGAAGNVSAQDLEMAAKSLEQACEREDMSGVTRALNTVEFAFSRVQSSLAALRQSSCAQKNEQENKGEPEGLKDLPQLLERLDKAIVDIDPVESGKLFNRIENDVSLAAFRSELDELRSCIDRYDFDGAKEKLDQLLKKSEKSI